jgi:hypothetical protein
MAGEMSGMAITQVFLFAVSLYIAIASVMVFLSLVLSPTVNRWTNIVLPSLYVVSIVASAIDETSAYYWFLSITESALLLGIVWYAWTWPRWREHLKAATHRRQAQAPRSECAGSVTCGSAVPVVSAGARRRLLLPMPGIGSSTPAGAPRGQEVIVQRS